MTGDTKSSWRSVIGGVPQGLILGPVLFSIFSDDLAEGAECVLSSSVGNTRLEGVVEAIDGWAAVRKDLTSYQESPEVQERRVDLCPKMPLGRNNPMHRYMLGPTTWKAALGKKKKPNKHFGSPCGHQVDCEPAMCPCGNRPTVSGAVIGTVLPAGQERWVFRSSVVGHTGNGTRKM